MPPLVRRGGSVTIPQRGDPSAGRHRPRGPWRVVTAGTSPRMHGGPAVRDSHDPATAAAEAPGRASRCRQYTAPCASTERARCRVYLGARHGSRQRGDGGSPPNGEHENDQQHQCITSTSGVVARLAISACAAFAVLPDDGHRRPLLRALVPCGQQHVRCRSGAEAAQASIGDLVAGAPASCGPSTARAQVGPMAAGHDQRSPARAGPRGRAVRPCDTPIFTSGVVDAPDRAEQPTNGAVEPTEPARPWRPWVRLVLRCSRRARCSVADPGAGRSTWPSVRVCARVAPAPIRR